MKSHLRVLLVMPEDELVGGVSVAVNNLARHLQASGHEVLFFFPGASNILRECISKSGIRAYRLNLQLPLGDRNPLLNLAAFGVRFPILMAQLLWLLLRYRIQVVNIHFPDDTFFYFALCARILSLALVTSIHGADILPGGKPRKSYSRLFRLLLHSSDLIVAPSKGYREQFLAVFPNSAGRAAVIYNGIDISQFEPADLPGAEESDPYILCVSAYKETKGLDVLIRAFPRIRESAPELKLVIVGVGPLKDSLKKMARELGVEDGIRFEGRVTQPEVRDLLRHCRLFVLPSRSESFGIAIVEALAAGKPVVATAVGGIPEILENGRNGLLVRPEDPAALAEAVLELHHSPSLRLGFSGSGRRMVQRFSLERMGMNYERIYRDLAGSSEGPVPGKKIRESSRLSQEFHD
jgi:glycosyltransferase involved in cell wall biosynthesis